MLLFLLLAILGHPRTLVRLCKSNSICSAITPTLGLSLLRLPPYPDAFPDLNPVAGSDPDGDMCSTKLANYRRPFWVMLPVNQHLLQAISERIFLHYCCLAIVLAMAVWTLFSAMAPPSISTLSSLVPPIPALRWPLWPSSALSGSLAASWPLLLSPHPLTVSALSWPFQPLPGCIPERSSTASSR